MRFPTLHVLLLLALAAGCSRTAPRQARQPVVGIQIDPPELTLAVGASALVTVQGVRPDGSTSELKDVIWSVARPGVVGVSGRQSVAELTGLGEGTAQVLISSRGLDGRLTVTVTGATPRRLEVTPPESSVSVGGQVALAAAATYSDGSTATVTLGADWSVSDSTIAGVGNEGSDKGRVIGHRAGKVSVKATWEGLEAKATVEVGGAELVRLDVTPPRATVPLETSIPLTAIAVFSDLTTSDVTDRADWSSGNEAAIRVSSDAPPRGIAQAVGAGSATLVATWQGRSGSAELAVSTTRLRTVEVSPARVKIAAGTTAGLKATAIFVDDTRQDVTWQARWLSSDARRVSVSALVPGTVKGETPGTATVSAELLGRSGAAEVTVTAAELTAIAVTPATLSAPKGSTAAFSATGTYGDQSTQEITTLVSWSSSDESVATVSNAQGSQGQAFARQPGAATVTASLSGLSAIASLAVTSAQLIELKVDPAAATLAKGTSVRLFATAIFGDLTTLEVTGQAAWSSSDNAVAPVDTVADRGRVDGVTPGQSTVTAAYGGKTASARISVTPATLVALTLAPLDPSLPKGNLLKMQARGRYSDGLELDVTAQVTWAVDDGAVALISNAAGSNGQVTALAKGRTVIQAALQGQVARTGLTVTEAELVSFKVNPAQVSLRWGQGSQQETATAFYGDGSAVDVTHSTDWTSLDPSIASVTSGGPARGLIAAGRRQGKTLVMAYFSGRSATVEVTVLAPRLSGLEVRPPALALASGTKGQLKAFATYEDGAILDVTATALWASSSPVVAVGNGAAGGLVEARSAGEARVSATYEGLSAWAVVTVTGPLAVSIAISPTSPTIPIGGKQAFTVRAFFSDGSSLEVTAQCAFVSADISVVGMVDNVAVGVRPGGPVPVTATYGSLTAQAQVTVAAATLTGLSLTPNGVVLQKGDTGAFRAIATWSDGSSRDVTLDAVWSSGDLSVCTVSSGQVKATGAGKTTVAASWGGLTAVASVLVEAPQLRRIAVVPPEAVLRPNLIYPYRSFALYSDLTTVEITKVTSWTSSNPSVARPYTQSGYTGLWAVGAGTAEVTAAWNGQTGKTRVQVFNSYLTGVEVSPAQMTLPVGVAGKLYGVFLYSDGWAVEILNPDWSSQNPAVARVDANGVVTAVAAGTTRIVMQAYDATHGQLFSSTAAVVVTSARIVSIAMDVPRTMVVGLSTKIQAVGTFNDGSVVNLGPSPVWSSSDLSLATVFPDMDSAKVTAKAAGQVNIGASFDGVSALAPVTLTAAGLVSLTLKVDQATLPLGGTSKVLVEGLYADGSRVDLTESVTYDSSDPDVALIAYGIWTNSLRPYVIAEQPGKAMVRASLSGKTAAAAIDVLGSTLQSLEVALGDAPPSSNVVLNGPGPFQLRAVGTFTGSVKADVTVMCTFQPGKTGPGVVATLSNAVAGRVTVISKGSQQVTVTYAPYLIGQPIVKGTATLTVP